MTVFQNCHGIIQKKSAPGSQMLPFVIFDKKVSFFPKKRFIFKVFLGKTTTKKPFLKRFQMLL